MRGQPASYRSGTAAFDLHVGSALKAILPGAFQGAVIGSLGTAGWFTIQYLLGGGAAGMADVAGAVMLFCFAMMVGTLGGTVVCAIYIGLVGLPLALLMRRHIATRAMLGVSLLAAMLTALIAVWMLMGALWLTPGDEGVTTALALVYAIPAGIAYRRAIITERLLSFWATEPV